VEHPSAEFRSPADPQPFKSLQTILDQEMQEAELELARPASGLLLSGLLAGLGVGFSILPIAALTTYSDEAPRWLLEILIANAYAIGFILVILARADLFTEYTTIAILPVLDCRSSVGRLCRLWGLVYLGNLLGAAILAGIGVLIGPALDVTGLEAFGIVARGLVEHPWWVILLSGGLAGWLMGLLSWLVTAGRETTSQILLIWLITGLIGYTHLHHAVTGSAEVLAGVFATADVSMRGFGHFLVWTTLGNAIGGFLFAWLIHNSALLAATRETRGPSGRRESQHQPRGDGKETH
jgi:formate-nitrite transporter family protein